MPRGTGKAREFFRSENAARIVTSHNQHKDFDCRQYGGTMLLALGEAASFVVEQGEDETGLGRWAWLLFLGKNNQRTRIVIGYRPCKAKDSQYSTVYTQHVRYFWKQRTP